MIYRKWSLLSGTAVATAGIIGAVVIGNLLFSQEDRYLKTVPPKKQSDSSSK